MIFNKLINGESIYKKDYLPKNNDFYFKIINLLISDGVYNNYIKQIFKKFTKKQKYININMKWFNYNYGNECNKLFLLLS